jgi:hypothetical protein
MANYLFDKDENGAGLGSMANRPRALDEPEGGILRRVEFAFLLLDDMTMAIPSIRSAISIGAVIRATTPTSTLREDKKGTDDGPTAMNARRAPPATVRCANVDSQDVAH